MRGRSSSDGSGWAAQLRSTAGVPKKRPISPRKARQQEGRPAGQRATSKLLQEMEESIQKLLNENRGGAVEGRQKRAQEDGVLDPSGGWTGKPERAVPKFSNPSPRVDVQQDLVFAKQGLPSIDLKPAKGKAVIADLCDRHKAKIAKLIQQVVHLSQDIKELRESTEKTDTEQRERIQQLEIESREWQSKYEQSRTKFGQSLTMLKTYQDKIVELEQQRKRTVEQQQEEENADIKRLNSQLENLTRMIEERQGQSVPADVAGTSGKSGTPNEAGKTNDANPLQMVVGSRKQHLVQMLEKAEKDLELERATVASALEESERARSRFEEKLSEHALLQKELQDAITLNKTKCTNSLPSPRHQQKHGANEEYLGISVRHSNSEEEEEEEEDVGKNVAKDANQDQILGDDDEIFEGFLRQQRKKKAARKAKAKHSSAYTADQGAKEKPARNLLVSSGAWSDEESALFENSNHGVLNPGTFENSHFESSLFSVIDDLEKNGAY